MTYDHALSLELKLVGKACSEALDEIWGELFTNEPTHVIGLYEIVKVHA